MAQFEQTVGADAVHAQLQRILASPKFDASARNRRFLSYVIEETLAGRGAQIKGYTIATSVFGRDENFDPQIDSIVRIEAGRLRRSLEHYYLTDGRDDSLRIEIPRGSYVPVCAVRQLKAASGPPSILIAPFEAEGDQSAHPNFTRGFVRILIIELTRSADLRVFGAGSTLCRPPDTDAQSLHQRPGVDYVLSGGTSLAPGRFEIDALLLEARTGQTVWAEAYECPFAEKEIIPLRNGVAKLVARTLTQPRGVIRRDRGAGREAATETRRYDAVPAFEASSADGRSPPGSCRIGRLPMRHARARHDATPAEARLAEAPGALPGQDAAAASAGRLGRRDAAAGAREHVPADLAARSLGPDVVHRGMCRHTEAGSRAPDAASTTAVRGQRP